MLVDVGDDFHDELFHIAEDAPAQPSDRKIAAAMPHPLDYTFKVSATKSTTLSIKKEIIHSPYIRRHLIQLTAHMAGFQVIIYGRFWGFRCIYIKNGIQGSGPHQAVKQSGNWTRKVRSEIRFCASGTSPGRQQRQERAEAKAVPQPTHGNPARPPRAVSAILSSAAAAEHLGRSKKLNSEQRSRGVLSVTAFRAENAPDPRQYCARRGSSVCATDFPDPFHTDKTAAPPLLQRS